MKNEQILVRQSFDPTGEPELVAEERGAADRSQQDHERHKLLRQDRVLPGGLGCDVLLDLSIDVDEIRVKFDDAEQEEWPHYHRDDTDRDEDRCRQVL